MVVIVNHHFIRSVWIQIKQKEKINNDNSFQLIFWIKNKLLGSGQGEMNLDAWIAEGERREEM